MVFIIKRYHPANDFFKSLGGEMSSMQLEIKLNLEPSESFLLSLCNVPGTTSLASRGGEPFFCQGHLDLHCGNHKPYKVINLQTCPLQIVEFRVPSAVALAGPDTMI